LVAGGGDIAVGAPPPGRAGWKIAIDDPSSQGQASPCTLVLHDVAISTSGDTRQFAIVEGQRYSHIINPADGLGLRYRGSTTVIAPDGAMADALATALSILPVSEGLRAIETVQGASAYIVRQTSPASAGWQRYSSRRFPQACGDARMRLQ
jgi:thiamine biosynthesis lipoprotein